MLLFRPIVMVKEKVEKLSRIKEWRKKKKEKNREKNKRYNEKNREKRATYAKEKRQLQRLFGIFVLTLM